MSLYYLVSLLTIVGLIALVVRSCVMLFFGPVL